MWIPLLLFLAANPTPEEIFQRAIRESETRKEKKFSYREDLEQFSIAKDGTRKRTQIETFDVIMLEGENYRKLILLDGKPLNPKRQKQVEEDLEQTRQQRRRSSLRTIRRTVRVGSLSDIQRLFDCAAATEESIGERKAWRLACEPKPDYKAKTDEEQKLLNTRRVLWFDQQDGVELQTSTTYTKATNGFQPGTEIESRYMNLNGAWVIEALTIRYELKAMAVVRAKGEARHRFYDYKVFQAESALVPE